MYQICVSGAHNGHSVEVGKRMAMQLGEAVAKAGHALMTGATVGLPNYAAEAYKAAGGTMSLGISPATSKVEHVIKYRLPTEAYDAILYSGLHYVGRDALLINSCDAVLSLGGRMGTLHEFAIAVETDTPIGFLQGAGGISDEIQDILKATGEDHNKSIFFSEGADDLLNKLMVALDSENHKYRTLYR